MVSRQSPTIGTSAGVDDRRARGEAVELAGDAVVEAGAEAHEQVALLQGGHRGDAPVHAGHPQVLRVAVGERAAGHQGRDDGDAGQLGEDAQLGGRAGLQHAAADVQHRPRGARDQPRGLADLLGVRPGRRAVARQVQHGRPREGALRLQDVLGQVDQDGARASGAGQVEGLGDRAGDVVGRLHEEVVLGDRHRDADDVGLLEGVRADRGARHLAGDGHQRDAVHVGVGDRRDEVGRARAARRHRDADLAGRLRVPLRGVPAALLVPDEDVPQPHAVEQRVVGGQDRAAGDAEHDLRTDALERAHERLGSGEGLGHLWASLPSGAGTCGSSPDRRRPLAQEHGGVSASAGRPTR